MRDALLQYLLTQANQRGLVFVRGDRVQRELGWTTIALEEAVGRLAREEILRILSPLPYLVVALKPRVWPGMIEMGAKTAAKSGHVVPRRYSYSFQQQSIDESKAIALEDGGDEEGRVLLKEILVTLGEADASSFRGVLRNYPAAKIRAVLARVRATPSEKLRKSRTALFRYLLPRSK